MSKKIRGSNYVMFEWRDSEILITYGIQHKSVMTFMSIISHFSIRMARAQ